MIKEISHLEHVHVPLFTKRMRKGIIQAIRFIPTFCKIKKILTLLKRGNSKNQTGLPKYELK